MSQPLKKSKPLKPFTSNGASRATSLSLLVSSISYKSFAVTSVSRTLRPQRSNTKWRACMPPKCSMTRICKHGRSNHPRTKLAMSQNPILSPLSTKERRSSTPNVIPAVFLTAAAKHPTIHHRFCPPSPPPFQPLTTTHFWNTPTAWKVHWSMLPNMPLPSRLTTAPSSENVMPNRKPSLSNRPSSWLSFPKQT